MGYFGFIDTDMVSRGMQTRTAQRMQRGPSALTKPVPLALESMRSSAACSAVPGASPLPAVGAALALRMPPIQPIVVAGAGGGLEESLATAREERPPVDDSPAR